MQKNERKTSERQSLKRRRKLRSGDIELWDIPSACSWVGDEGSPREEIMIGLISNELANCMISDGLVIAINDHAVSRATRKYHERMKRHRSVKV